MGKVLVSDELWALVEPLLPPLKPRRFRHPGRKPLDNRRALTGILFVLKSGIPWGMLPKEMGCGSGTACWTRLRDWQKAGVWQQLHETLLAKLQEADKLDWSRAAADSSSVRAVFGGAKRVRALRTEGRWARSTTSSRKPKAYPFPASSARQTVMTLLNSCLS